MKNLKFDIGGIFKDKENDIQRITKIAYVKILLEQCWQKGFNVDS